jgi:hypothetical protein
MRRQKLKSERLKGALFSAFIITSVLATLLLISAKAARGENIQWTRQFVPSEAYAMAVDGSGNVYVAGTTRGELPGQTSPGGQDAFVRKYDGSGNEVWTRQFGSSSNDMAEGVAIDGSGNVYVAGITWGTFPGQTSSGSGDAFVRKYDSAGNEVWTRQFGTSEDWDLADGVAVDASGNVYVAGDTIGALPEQTLSGDSDAFVRKYDATGNEVWTRQFGTSAGDSVAEVAVDGSGNVYVTGFTLGALPGQTLSGDSDAFVRKYDASGNEIWTRQFGTSSSDGARGADVDVSGNVYVAGSTGGAFPGQTSSGSGDAFIRKYDGSGNEVWTKQFGTSASEDAGGIAVDNSGNVYVAGNIYSDGAFPGQTSSGNTDTFVRKYDGSGNEVWTRQFGSPESEDTYGVAVDPSGNVYVAGYTWGVLPGQTVSGGSFLVKFVEEAVEVVVKAGDWIKYDYTISGVPSGTNLPRWIKLEFLSVEGTSANVRVTMHMADGTEQSDNVSADVAAGGGTFAGLSGFVIPANSKAGDSINMSGYGTVTIAGEKTKTYARASRTVVFANIPQYGLSYYWDKQTGIMVEASAISGTMTGTAKATETNMWQAGPQAPSGGSNWPLIAGIVVVIVVIGIVATVYVRRR